MKRKYEKHINPLLIFTILLLWPFLSDSQITKTTMPSGKVTTSQPALFNVLNAPSKQDLIKQEFANISAGTQQIGMSNNSSIGYLMGKEKTSIFYGVPIRVALDRYLLQENVQNRIAELLDLKTTWENSGDSQKKQIVKDFIWKKGSISEEELTKILNSPTVPDVVAQKMAKLFQDQINDLQVILDNLYYNCPPVDFKSKAASVKAEVRFHSPVSNALGFMRAFGNGSVRTSALFENVPFSSYDGAPISGSLLIYEK